MTTRNNNTNTNTAVLEPEVAAAQSAEATGNSTDLPKSAAKLGGGLIAVLASRTDAVQARMTLRQTIRQHLAEVADMAKEAGDTTAEVTAKAAAVGYELFDARRTGQLQANEVSEILGEIFGVKGTGKNVGKVMRPGEKGAGKTPAGTGEEIRKRVVRAVAAADFVANGPSPATKYFNDSFEQSDIQPLLNDLSPDGDGNIWSFYRQLQEMKRVNNDPVPFHLNAERIAKFATSISEGIKQTAANINGNNELKAAYAGLMQQILLLNDLIDA